MLFCVDIGALHSCVRDTALERIVNHSVRTYIPIIDYTRDFKLGDTLVRSRGMVELILPAPRSTLDISVIRDVVDVEIPPFLVLDILEGNNLLVDNVTNHLCNRIIINKDPLRFEDM